MEPVVIVDSFIDTIEENKEANKSVYHTFDNIHTRLGSHSIITDDDDMRGLMQHFLLLERIIGTYASNELERGLRGKIASEELLEYVTSVGEPTSGNFDEIPEHQLRSILLDRIENISYQQSVNKGDVSRANYTGLLENLGYDTDAIDPGDDQASPSPTRSVSVELVMAMISDLGPEINDDIYDKFHKILQQIRPMVVKGEWNDVFSKIDEHMIQLDREARSLSGF
jgi:hypothetical protein